MSQFDWIEDKRERYFRLLAEVRTQQDIQRKLMSDQNELDKDLKPLLKRQEEIKKRYDVSQYILDEADEAMKALEKEILSSQSKEPKLLEAPIPSKKRA